MVKNSEHEFFSSVDEYVKFVGGDKAVHTILIANNGIAAVKAIRSIRKWTYATFGNANAIQFVVMATPEDMKANAEYIRMADQIEEVPGGVNSNNYANVDLIVEIAEKRGVQAVWAGWGHASENPRLPAALSKTKNDIRFIGPPAKAMRDLGDKIASTLVAQSAKVSCVPWSGTGLTLDYSKQGIPEDIYIKACVTKLEEAQSALEKIGLPAMIKASEGGGGKGIRKITTFEQLPSAFRQVQGEVPGSPIFIMKMVNKCHHLEVQLVGDMYGNAISLYGRDCSVQRRHQKIIEEGPAIAAPPEVFEEMEQAAIRLGKEVGYVGAGTVEYLFEEETNSYYFLELNPRLQVEHPVTELITDVNLVATQVNIAMGVPLHRIPDIRRFYELDPFGDSPIDFSVAKRRPPIGHVIAARITGENPDEGFKPTSGGIKELTFRSTPNVWGYFSVGPSGGLHEYADSQFGHVFSRGKSREESRKELIVGLTELSIRGDISTPVAYVTYLLETDIFKNNQVTTEWLDHLIANDVHEEKPDPWLVVLCGALFKAHTVCTERYDHYISYLERGQIPPKDLLKVEDFFDLIYQNTKYCLKTTKTGDNSYNVFIREKEGFITGEVRTLVDGGLLILLNGKSYVCYGNDTVSGLRLILNGKTCHFTKEYDPTQLRSSTSGKLVRYLVENGSHIKANSPYAEMEVMKMYLPLIASEPGIITFVQQEGSILEAGTIVATLELDDPSKVSKVVVYDGKLPSMGTPRIRGEKQHHLLRETLYSINQTLKGFCQEDTKSLVLELFRFLADPILPILEFQECLAKLASKMPKTLYDSITTVLSEYSASISNNSQPFLASPIKALIDDHLEEIDNAQKKKETLNIVEPLLELAQKYEKGPEKHENQVIRQILSDFVSVEKNYNSPREQTLAILREKYRNDLHTLFEIELSHANLSNKNKLILGILDEIRNIEPYSYLLHELSELVGSGHNEVPLKSKRMLIRSSLPSFEQRKLSMEKQLIEKKLDSLISSTMAISDVLSCFFNHSSRTLREAASEVYIRRAYHAYDVKGFSCQWVDGDILKIEWFYGSNLLKSSSNDRQKPSGMKRVYTDATFDLSSLEKDSLDQGLMFQFKNEEDVFRRFPSVFSKFRPTSPGKSHKLTGELNNILKITFEIPEDQQVANEQEVISRLEQWLQGFADELRAAGTRRVTFVIFTSGQFPRIYTFRERLGYQEDTIYRHIEPPLAFQLELRRMSKYDLTLVPTENKQVHLFYGEEKGNTSPSKHCCIFARASIRLGEAFNFTKDIDRMNEYLISEAENVLRKAINAIELALGEPHFKNAWHNHIFMCFMSEVSLGPENVRTIIRNVATKYERRLAKVKVATVEILGELKSQKSDASPTPVRFITTNPTRTKFNTDAYVELRDANNKSKVLSSLFGPAPLDGQEAGPYLPPTSIDKKRVLSAANNTTYVYDFVELFEEALRKIWENYLKDRPHKKAPKDYVLAKELVLNSSGGLDEVIRPPGQNDIGMVAWKLRLFTPEYPNGRFIILIANDITYQIGSFGPQEDVLFYRASQQARKLGIPRLYVAANSGARIGLAKEVQDRFRVEWADENDPSKGFNGLYITDEEYEMLSKQGSIQAIKVDEDKWKITDIIGASDGLGVENLRGSGMIAGETSRAYEEIFTLTLVTGRTVGIGAYLVRLGQRVIQNKGPVILTGALALNKVLGRDVYLSNHQLGGTQIMFTNGVSHLIVNDELAGIIEILQWLSYVPKKKGDPIPIVDSLDPVERKIEFVPTKSPYDPRQMLAGYRHESTNEWISGFFDKDSFQETLAGWGKTVVCGRARLGGIPMGVIAVETRTVEHVIPADPAVSESTESVIQQAGQVWFPDSAYKTAQAIKDFNNGEELPLIIFANWRGFSGGLRDLFDEILKFGSYIVDNLREYQQPVFIYLPPEGELRGGAWVVVDPTINPEKMEMYSDAHSRGGVLEPNGIVEIKYKARDIIKTMHRLDNHLKELVSKLKTCESKETAKQLQIEIEKRQAELMPIYHQIAITFAELHDTPGRMKAKEVIRDVLNWETAREFFYYRVKRRMHEEYLLRAMKKADPSLQYSNMMKLLEEYLVQSQKRKKKNQYVWDNDKFVASWYEEEKSNILDFVNTHIRARYIKNQAINLFKENPDATMEGILQFLNSLPGNQKANFLKKLK